MNNDFTTQPLNDLRLFGPLFLVFAGLLTGFYIFIGPPGSVEIGALVRSAIWSLIDTVQAGF